MSSVKKSFAVDNLKTNSRILAIYLVFNNYPIENYIKKILNEQIWLSLTYMQQESII